MIGPRYVAREVDYGALVGRESAPGFALARVAADGSRGQELVLVRGDGEYVCMRRGFEDAGDARFLPRFLLLQGVYAN